MSNAEFIFGALRAWFLNPLWNLLLVNLSTLSLFFVSSSHLHDPNIALLINGWCWTKHFSALSIFCRKYLSFVLILPHCIWYCVLASGYIALYRVTTIETLVHFTYCRYTGNLPNTTKTYQIKGPEVSPNWRGHLLLFRAGYCFQSDVILTSKRDFNLPAMCVVLLPRTYRIGTNFLQLCGIGKLRVWDKTSTNRIWITIKRSLC